MAKRRTNGEGTIRKRVDGRWEGAIVVGHKNDGKPITKSVFAKTQKEIEVIPITFNRSRRKLSNLNLYEILSFCSANFHYFSSFCMSQSEEKRVSQQNECISQAKIF